MYMYKYKFLYYPLWVTPSHLSFSSTAKNDKEIRKLSGCTIYDLKLVNDVDA